MKVSITSRGIPSWETTAESHDPETTKTLLLDAVAFLETRYGMIVREEIET